MSRNQPSSTTSVNCGCLILVILINVTIGAYAFAYCLDSFFAKDASGAVDIIGGLVLGEIVIPLAILCWILKVCGVETPFIH